MESTSTTATGLPATLCERFDRVFWMGDLNYRISATREGVDALLNAQDGIEKLLPFDQLLTEMRAGNVFEGFHEAKIHFAPTYKFDIATDVYDSSSKKRVPAYTDRILCRDNSDSRVQAQSLSASSSHADLNTASHTYNDSTTRHSAFPKSPSYPRRTVGAPNPASYVSRTRSSNSPASSDSTLQSQHPNDTMSTSAAWLGSPLFGFGACDELESPSIRLLKYDSCRELRVSGHRPVFAAFEVAFDADPAHVADAGLVEEVFLIE